MAKFETGDIVIIKNDRFGHVAMCYSPGNQHATFIHGTRDGNFHISQQQTQVGHSFQYIADKNYRHFRPKFITFEQKEALLQIPLS